MNTTETFDAIYKLEMHETYLIAADSNTFLEMRRVPGGWLYTETYTPHLQEGASCSITSTFVPWVDRK